MRDEMRSINSIDDFEKIVSEFVEWRMGNPQITEQASEPLDQQSCEAVPAG